MKIPAILLSKKFQTLIGAVLVVLNSDSVPGILQMSTDTTKQIIALVMVYIGAQGIADHGKEKAKIEIGAD